MNKAQDYVFQESGAGLIYLAKKTDSKKYISEDRRPVENWEIIQLFEHFLRHRCKEVNDVEIVITLDGKEIFKAELLDKENK